MAGLVRAGPRAHRRRPRPGGAVDRTRGLDLGAGPAREPIVDILLQVADTVAESTYVPHLEAAGFALRVREPEWLEHRLLRRRGAPHDVNLHVFSPRYAEEEIARMLAFRDWLRTHEADRNLYAATKRELSTREWRYTQDYAEAKSEVVKQILARATA